MTTEPTYETYRNEIDTHRGEYVWLMDRVDGDLIQLKWAIQQNPQGELLRMLAETARKTAERLETAAALADAEAAAREAMEAYFATVE